MLTRLRVSGFKNLIDVDIRFGPFTCIAGTNGVGKSNLFDAIHFLSALANLPLIEAALSVRGSEGGDIRSLFHQVGNTYADEMLFVAEMVIPSEAVDELGQTAEASTAFVKYSLRLGYRPDSNLKSLSSLEILEETLETISQEDTKLHLKFNSAPDAVRESAPSRNQERTLFISTSEKSGNRTIQLHQDGSIGSVLSRLASKLPRTVLSATNAAESPTVLITRQEMRSWRLLQLEPTSLRQSDVYTAPPTIETNGSHIAATLYHLANPTNGDRDIDADAAAAQIYANVANRLSELVSGIKSVWIDQDDQRQLLTLMVSNRDGAEHPARALSDGTLRFLALTILELDLKQQGIICLEEPENGIHPESIPNILQLLQDIAIDTDEEVGADNPLRQVIINTHSPAVVKQVPADSLVIAELRDTVSGQKRFKRVCFEHLPDTWRQNETQDSEPVNTVALGKLLGYLNPVSMDVLTEEQRGKRVIDRADLAPLIPERSEQLA